MKIIGITGGVGSGKSMLLEYIKEHYNCCIVLADDVANKLKEPGEACYEPIVALLGRECVGADGHICRNKMAERIFGDRELLQKVNEIIHPAVKAYIVQKISQEKEKGELDFFFLEAALLIECGYENIVEEMWYIYADEAVRRVRLKAGRNYTDEKIDSILKSQLSEEIYRKHCRTVIDNSRELVYAYEQIDKKMGEYLWKK